GRRLEGGRRVRQEAERLAAAHATPAERLRAAYDFVRTTVVWDRHYDVFADRSADDVLAAGRGSSAEVNLLLLAVLRAMGLEATPILLSTRSNGRPLPLYPLLSQFNHVVVLAAAGGSPVLLDATDRDLPAGLLPVEALAGMGWRVDHSDPSWITFQPLDRTGTVAQVTGALAPDGTASGTLSFRLTGYAAGKARARLRETATDGPAAPVAELVEAPDGAEIDSVAVVQADDVYEPVDLSASFRLQGAAESIGDRLYLTPVLFGRHRESPFGLVERTYPVEFGHPFSQTYSAQIELPEGYEVEALPPALSRNLPGQSARYARSVTVVGRALHVQMRFEVRTPTFEPAAYPALRALFDEMVAADAEPIVLRPIAAEAAPSADAGGRP
ncbi:MAG TPA: transglutaminase domain-containing protein, partial [Rubricoccaceae bacterium]|nr:transglutaminase domain-containing protein [Rubricoccaceae bacterium]